MRVLFDQGAPVPIAAYRREHTVRTTLEEGWDTLVNGELLRVAEASATLPIGKISRAGESQL